jgi:hypothetical protein
MLPSLKGLLKAAPLLFALGLSASTSANAAESVIADKGSSTTATISTDYVGPVNPAINDTFTVPIAVTSNSHGIAPGAFNVRVEFDNSSLELLTSNYAGEQVGPVYVGPVEGIAPNNFVDIGSLGAANSDFTPSLADLEFRVRPTTKPTFSIVLEYDPATGSTLLANDFSTNLGVILSSALTVDIEANVPKAVVTSAIESGSLEAGETFVVIVGVEDSPTTAPAAVAFRMAYDESVFEVDTTYGNGGVLSANLGPAYIGPNEGGFRDIGTLGNSANTFQTVDAFTVRFKVNDCPNSSSSSIVFSDDPDASVNILAVNLVDEIPHVFNTGTSDLNPIEVPVDFEMTPDAINLGTFTEGSTILTTDVLTVTNNGSCPIDLDGSFTGAVFFSAVDTPGDPIDGGTSDTITIAYDIASLTPGFYTGALEVVDLDSGTTDSTVFTVNIEAAPELLITPDGPLNFAIDLGENVPAQLVGIENIGGGVINFITNTTEPWLAIEPTTGTLTAFSALGASLSFDTASLAGGSYVGELQVLGGSTSDTLVVNLDVNADPTIELTPLNVPITIVEGEDTSTVLSVANTGAGDLNYTATFAAAFSGSVTPTTGTLGQDVSEALEVFLDSSAFTPGNYQAEVAVADPLATNGSATSTIDLTVLSLAIIELNKSSITRNAVAEGTNPTADSFTITNGGDLTLNYNTTVTYNEVVPAPWLMLNNMSGSLSPASIQMVNVGFNTTTLAPGTYTATISIADPAAKNSPQQILVTLNINAIAEVTATVIDGTPCLAGEEFTVQVAVTRNNGGLAPRNYIFRVGWNDNSVEFVSAAPVIGSLATTPNNVPNPSAPNFRKLIASELFSASSNDEFLTPLANVTFRTKNSFVAPFDITLAVDGVNNVLSGGEPESSTSATPIPSVFNVAGVTGLGLCGLIAVSPTDFGTTITEGQNAMDFASILGNEGNAVLNYQATSDAAWLSVTPSTGALAVGTTTTLNLITDTAALAPGDYAGTVQVADMAAGNSPKEITVLLTVLPLPPAIIDIDTTAIDIDIVEGSATPDVTRILANVGAGAALNYTVAATTPRITITPDSGTLASGTSTTLTIALDTATLLPGQFSQSIQISGNATNSPQIILVNVDVKAAVPTTAAFEFAVNEEGWTFTSANLPLSDLGLGDNGNTDPVVGTAQNGGLDIDFAATDATATVAPNRSFAYWTSPRFITTADSDLVEAGEVGIQGRLFRAMVNVSTDITTASLVPTFRLRGSAWDWQRADYVQISSVTEIVPGAEALLPTPAGRNYVSWFEVPETSNSTDALRGATTGSFRYEIDLTHFDAADAFTGKLSVNSVQIDAIDPEDLNGTQILSLNFAGDDNGFTPRTVASAFAEPLFSATPSGLRIQGIDPLELRGIAPNPTPLPIVRFGYWGLEATGNTITGGNAYRVDFTVAGGGASVENMPTFRLRVNDSSLAYSAVANINSSNSLSRLPIGDESFVYSLYFDAPNEIDGNFWIFSFDYIYASVTGDSETAYVELQEIVVTEYAD